MPDFAITWAATISADTPEDAARIALEALLDPAFSCRHFVVDSLETSEQIVDLGASVTHRPISRPALRVVGDGN